jgi:hypothetical protein
MMNEVLLIKLVRGYEHLYNRKNKLYHDIGSKSKAWSEISKQLNYSGKYRSVCELLPGHKRYA